MKITRQDFENIKNGDVIILENERKLRVCKEAFEDTDNHLKIITFDKNGFEELLLLEQEITDERTKPIKIKEIQKAQ